MPTVNRDAYLKTASAVFASRGKSFAEFDRKIALAIYQACETAIIDGKEGKAVYRMVSANTGTAKTTFALCYVASLVKAEHTALFLSDTMRQCNDAYVDLCKLLDESRVAVWTTAHDRLHPTDDDDCEKTKGFAPAARFAQKDLGSRPAAICSHQFFQGPNSAPALNHKGKRRTLTIVDEKPSEVEIFDVSIADVVACQEAVVRAIASEDPLVPAIIDLSTRLQEVWGRTGPKPKGRSRYEDLGTSVISESAMLPVLDLADDDEKAAKIAAKGQIEVSLFQSVVGLMACIHRGCAFIAHYTDRAQGARFIGYRHAFPLHPGTVLLDATCDIDGVALLRPDLRKAVPVPHPDYRNLTIKQVFPPKDLTGDSMRRLFGHRDTREQIIDWVHSTVLQNTDHGEKVLVVAHKVNIDSGDLGKLDWQGRGVTFCHWGYGIGSNAYKDCTTVVLVGEFHRPRSTYVAETLGLKGVAFNKKIVSDAQQLRRLDGVYAEMQEGHLLRWVKQLACRGNVRNMENGVAGKMRLVFTGEFSRLMLNKDRLFPGSPDVILDNTAAAFDQLTAPYGSIADRIMHVLSTENSDIVTATRIEERTGIALRSNWKRLLDDPKFTAWMDSEGWEFVPGGRGRGRAAMFRKLHGKYYGLPAVAAE